MENKSLKQVKMIYYNIFPEQNTIQGNLNIYIERGKESKESAMYMYNLLIFIHIHDTFF